MFTHTVGGSGCGRECGQVGYKLHRGELIWGKNRVWEKEKKADRWGCCGSLKALQHCSLMPLAPLTDSALLAPPPPPGFLGPSWGGELGGILQEVSGTLSFLPPHPSCCLEASGLRCPAFSTHLSSPRHCHFCHTMIPISRAAVPKPPRIPRARARVPSAGPPTEPVGR